MRKINLKGTLKRIEELSQRQCEQGAVSFIMASVEPNGKIRANITVGLPNGGKTQIKYFDTLYELSEFPGITEETQTILDDMELATDMYLPLDLILWFLPAEEIQQFIQLARADDQPGWLARYIELIQTVQEKQLSLPDGLAHNTALQDLIENYSRFTLEALVERYQDRRWVVPYDPNR